MRGIDLIAVERARQLLGIESGGEGYDEEHDAGNHDELAFAAATYALPPDWTNTYETGMGTAEEDRAQHLWPWEMQYWKPTPHDRIRELTKAGALIAAAIDAVLLEYGDD